ncbi:MAG: hypothetical protein RL172_1418 [Bacteroidota bacterium]|jgi:cellobiose epimerase
MTVTGNEAALKAYSQQLHDELQEILNFWMQHTVDTQYGGFVAAVDNLNQPTAAAKGVVLNSRILWTFSAAWLHSPQPAYLDMAHRAFNYLCTYFVDTTYGGVYWSVQPNGSPADTRKQIYGLAFCIYGLAEYYKASKHPPALHLAQQLFEAIEQHSFDKANGGYFEAFNQQWQPIQDLRLSDKDDNEKKTMNTHLHIIEAYANLYSVTGHPALRDKIIHLLEVFDKYIINHQNGHLNLFMDENWQVKSTLVSYGHDIEAAWLLLECAQIIQHHQYIKLYTALSIQMANAAAEGLDADGALWYEYEPLAEHLIKEKHWWPQAEAMVGFLNAYQLCGQQPYLQQSLHAWQFVQQYLKDEKHGEWWWGVEADYSIIQKEKAGFWKCPYHNGRACIEVIKRIQSIL